MTSQLSSSLPKWQPIFAEKSLLSSSSSSSFLINLTHQKLIFGLTPPTMAVCVLAIFLCILLEISTRNPRSSSDLVDPKRVSSTERKQVTMIKFWIKTRVFWSINSFLKHHDEQWWFFYKLVECYDIIRSWVLKGVLDFEKEGKFIWWSTLINIIILSKTTKSGFCHGFDIKGDAFLLQNCC